MKLLSDAALQRLCDDLVADPFLLAVVIFRNPSNDNATRPTA